MAERASGFLRGRDPLTVVALIVIVAGTAQLLFGALDAGVTTDEPIEAESAQSWLDTGWFDPSFVLSNGAPNPNDPLSNPYVHGPAFGAVAHLANMIAGNESAGEISYSSGAYAVRHLVSALLAWLAVAAVGAAVWLLTRSRRFGLWAAAGLLAIPEWTGQGFFNPKDTPAASGYTLLTVALVFALWETPGEPASPRRRVGIAAALAGGIFIGGGTRPALLLPFLFTVLVYAALRLGQRRLGGLPRHTDMDLAVAAGTGIGLAAIAVIYPNAAATPLKLLVESVSSSSAWAYQGFTLTAGQLLTEHPPWWYLPVWIGASVPLLLAGLAVLGGVLGVRALLGAGAVVRRGALWQRRDLGLALVLMQALLLPLGAIVNGAVIYNGMRQHIYVLPAIAILAGLGAWRLWGWAQSKYPVGRGRAIVTVTLCAALLVPMFEQTLLFPYNYAYVNPVAGIGGVNDNWETDYWYASGREALSRVPRSAELLCSRFLVEPWDTDGRPELEPCDEEQLTPFTDERGTEVASRWRDDTAATWVISRKRAGNRPPSYCEEADNVTRWLRGEEVVMAYVLRCDPEEAARDVVR